jgi:hypothetical protein
MKRLPRHIGAAHIVLVALVAPVTLVVAFAELLVALVALVVLLTFAELPARRRARAVAFVRFTVLLVLFTVQFVKSDAEFIICRASTQLAHSTSLDELGLGVGMRLAQPCARRTNAKNHVRMVRSFGAKLLFFHLTD